MIEKFIFLEDWMAQYEYIIKLGKSLLLIDKQHQTNENIIKGVRIHATKLYDKIIFTADSDVFLTKGIIALLLRFYSNQTPETIQN